MDFTRHLKCFKCVWFYNDNQLFLVFLLPPDICIKLEKLKLKTERDQLKVILNETQTRNMELKISLTETLIQMIDFPMFDLI